MSRIPFGPLPERAIVQGDLHLDPGHEYPDGDVLLVQLPNGFEIEVSHGRHIGPGPFLISAYCRAPGHAQAQPVGEWFAERPEVIVMGIGNLARDLMRYRVED